MLSALTPYMTAIKLAIVAVAFAAGVGTGIHHEQPKIAALNQTIGADNGTIQNLTIYSAAQNKGLDDLKAAQAAREKAAKDAVDAAQNEARAARHTAAAILSKKLPKGANQCLAAENDFRQELKNERGLK